MILAQYATGMSRYGLNIDYIKDLHVGTRTCIDDIGELQFLCSHLINQYTKTKELQLYLDFLFFSRASASSSDSNSVVAHPVVTYLSSYFLAFSKESVKEEAENKLH